MTVASPVSTMLGLTLATVTVWVSELLNALLESLTCTETVEPFGPSAKVHSNEPVVWVLVSEPAAFDPVPEQDVVTGVMVSPSGSLIE